MVYQKVDDNNNEMFNMAPLAHSLPAMTMPSPGPVGSLPPTVLAPADPHLMTQMRLLHLIDKYGYQMMQFNGQRRTGPPKDWEGPTPGPGCEIFIGKIPRDLYEDELLPVLMKFGRVYEMRLMMDFSGTNRGFGFAQFATPEVARLAVKGLDGYAIRPGKYLGVMKSLDNRRLFVGGLPKDRSKQEIMEELSKLVQGIVNVILYSSVVDKTKNRGFAFVEFESHRVAAIARRKMIPGGVCLWDHELAVDWAEPEPEVSECVMSKVKVLYVRNLMLSTPEAVIKEVIEKYAQIPKGAIEKVKKLKDFAFLHFTDRHFAEQALQRLDKMNIDGSEVSVVWAKPPRDRVQHRSRNSFNDDSSSIAEDNLATPKGRPIIRSPNSTSTPSSMSSISQSPYMYWDTLLSMCGQQEPVANVTSWPSPTKPGALMFMARITVPFLQPPFNIFHGNFASSPQEAINSTAENVVSWMYRNGGQHSMVFTTPPPPVGFVYPSGPYSPVM